MMRGAWVGLMGVLVACGGSEPAPGDLIVVSEDAFGVPVAGLDREMRDRFDLGDARFETSLRPAQGLGPLYIRSACSACHRGDGKGPGGVTKMVLVEPDGVTPKADQSALAFGHTVRPELAAGATIPIDAPEVDGIKVSRRIGPAVVGRGAMEAIADEEIERIEAEQRARGDAIHGRINRIDGRIGRFGVKARIVTVEDFVADAYQGDMGMTSPIRPDELENPEGLVDDDKPGVDLELETLELVADYVRLLAIPRRASTDAAAQELFDRICASCHVPSLRTDDDYPIAALAGIDAPVYTDLLVHDMGGDLADGLAEQGAGPRDWRTAPLIGLRHQKTYLHDGRAATVEEAILMHEGEGSEANDAVAAFEALGDDDRVRLLELVGSL